MNCPGTALMAMLPAALHQTVLPVGMLGVLASPAAPVARLSMLVAGRR